MAKQATLKLIETEPQRISVDNHWYSLDGGPRMPGVTGILKVQDALMGDGLTSWAARLAAKAAFDVARRPEMPEFEDALAAAIETVDEARNRGSRVHDGIDAAVQGKDHVPTERDGKLWYHWSRFLLRKGLEVIATEYYIVGDGFGGTYDMDAMVDGKRSLIDVKTGKYKDSFPLQLAGYSMGRWQAPKSTGTPVTPVPEFEAFYVLMLSDDGYQLLEQKVGDEERAHFRYLVETHKKLHAWSRRGKAA